MPPIEIARACPEMDRLFAFGPLDRRRSWNPCGVLARHRTAVHYLDERLFCYLTIFVEIYKSNYAFFLT